MAKDRSFSVASNNVHSQKFDDEIIILDTKSGVYFSLRTSAVDIWSGIEAGASRDAIAATLIARYNADSEVIGAAVDRCLADLLKDGLIREVSLTGPVASATDVSGSRLPFIEPSIERFTDMQNLLLLDPVHEVSDEGWPQQRVSSERE